MILGLFAALLAFGASAAFAAPPEKPDLSVESHFATPPSPPTQAILHGTLDPGKVAGSGPYETGTYEFIYNPGPSCVGGSATPQGMSLGEGEEALPEEHLSGLAQSTEYTVCVRFVTAEGEALSNEVTFTTPPPVQEAPVTREVKSVTGTTATLHGELNPLNSATVGYEFMYNATSAGTGCEGGTTTTPGAEKTGKGIPVSKPVTGLTPSTEYSFCVVALNNAGEPAIAPPLTFRTPAEAPEIVAASEKASGVTPFEAVLEGTVQPSNQSTSCELEYGETTAYGTKVSCGTLEGGEQGVAVSVAHLTPATTYHFRFAVKNSSGEGEGTGHFTTLTAEKPLIESETAPSVTPFEATLETVVNPEYQETSCKFEYGTEASLTTHTTMACNPSQLGAAGTPTGASLTLKGLAPATPYFYRVVVSNGTGISEGAITEVKTLTAEKPLIESESSPSVAPFEATLEAAVNPEYQLTSCEFQYGKTTGYGTSKACSPASLEGSGGQGVSASITSLEPATTYHYRVLAKNTTGTSEGTGEFTTPALEAPGIESETAPVVTPYEAQLETVVNAKYQETACQFEYGTDSSLATHTTAPCNPAHLGNGGGGVGASAVLTGLTHDTTYYYRVAATNGTGTTTDATIETFTTLTPKAPIIESESASSITQTSVTLEAQVNPEYQATPYTFEYATEESVVLEGHGTSVAGATIPPGSIATGFSEHLAKVDLTGLTPNQTYFYRVLAHNPTGSATPMVAIASFTTSSVPAATTGSSTGQTPTTATVTGTVNPNGASTTYYFQYGGTTSYGKQTSSALAGAGDSPVPISIVLQGLEPGTTTHYRLAATNTNKGVEQITYGADQTVSTPATPPLVSGLSVSAVTESTATISATVEGRNLPTTYKLELGATAGNLQPASAPCPGDETRSCFASGNTDTTALFSAAVSDLTPGTTYYYKLVVNSQSGTVEPEGAFTTAPGPAAAPAAGLLAVIPYTTIAQYTAKEPKEVKTTPPTKKQKLAKALKTCKKDKKKSKRKQCEKQARKKF